MNDMRAVIIPKSDQINADDLLGGPMTITVTKVSIRPGTEQPVSINFDGDNGKPYKPCKSMARVMVHCWGPDANEYVGRSMTLYCDPKVLWGGLAVGGIRISHMTHLKAAQTMALTATKGSKKPFTVRPLAVAEDAPTPPAKTQAPQMTLAEWIGDALPKLLAACKTSLDVEALTGKRGYQGAFAKADDEQKQEMQRLVTVRLDAIAADDDVFPGDLPSQETVA